MNELIKISETLEEKLLNNAWQENGLVGQQNTYKKLNELKTAYIQKHIDEYTGLINNNNFYQEWTWRLTQPLL